jgi:hypothetical protein
MRELEGRQDRLRGGSVKSVRFCGPRCLPPSDASQPLPAPKHGELHDAFFDRVGVHVMRIAQLPMIRFPFRLMRPVRLRARGLSTRG